MSGFKQDTEVAEYLYFLAFHALENGGREATRAGIKNRTSFMYGMADRMSLTLHAMKKKELDERPSDSTALMVIKDQVVKQELSKLKKVFAKATSGRVEGDAYTAGMKAGASIQFNPALKDRSTRQYHQLA